MPAETHHASVAGRPLALPPAQIRRIVVIGDTGCRLKEADDAWQACNDPAAYPFARIAAQAAAWHPDAVVHVGDYLYRENPCPAGNAGCADSPWGYGWDAWQADFFAPARSLLEAAPWIAVRGNHESCTRGGQGWWRLLDPRPLVPGRDCNDPANDREGNFSPAYAVPFGAGAQLVVMDLSAAGTEPLADGDWRLSAFEQTYRDLARFSHGARFTFAADHYPLFGVAVDEGELKVGNPAIQRAFAQANPKIVPQDVDVLLGGHIHVWEQADFGGRQPSQFVAGFSGTQEDIVPLPTALPQGLSPASGVPVRRFSSIIDKFGFMTLERTGHTAWRAVVYSVDGEPLQRCRIHGRRSDCKPA